MEEVASAHRGGCDELEEGAKHLKAARRANRFDPERKFGAVHGRTVSHRDKLAWFHDEDVGLEMVVERPESNDGVVLSKLDLEGCTRPELMTDTPVRNGVAEELCRVLEELCVASSIRRHPENPDVALRVFELPAAGVRRGGDAAADRGKPVPLLAAPARQAWDAEPTTYATLAVGPPEELLEQSLMPRAKLRWSGCAELPKAQHQVRASRTIKPSCAAISYPIGGCLDQHRQQHGLSSQKCWVQDSPESYLEVDLGGNCNVTHVSTMGRFPPMMSYPSNEQKRMWLMEHPELSKAEQRSWWVVCPKGHGWEQWVTRYELQARLEGGKQWLSVGTLKGNVDMTSEVAHDLREVCHSPDGLQCRFLRFIPQGHHGSPAMRVGVYGTSLAKDGSASKGEQLEQQRVRYLIPFPLNNRNMRRRQRTFIRAGSPDFRGKYGSDYPIQRRRRLLQRATLIETREAADGQEGHCTGESEDAKQEGERADVAEEYYYRRDPCTGARLELRRAVSQRMEEALKGPAPLVRTVTDEARGYCSEPEDFEVVDVPCSQQQAKPAPEEQPALLRSRTDEHRGYCSEPEEPLVADAGDSEWTVI